jgi:hypothetical protein
MSDEQLQSLFVGMERHLDKRADAIEERLDKRVDALEERLNARIEAVETKLLTEFHKWASPTEARLRGNAATLQALDLELELLKERVKKLESRAA